ncbi:hypothetical protein H5410_035814 [Solanum commersonii]|uniref:Uncharacterized protein n=1 Tax=Solanum commersonii TaxID=4109 RepID=A0A9J5Y6A6_SOLCO|nr:hypothetical protein H5410_035814 [Solanum commersonii]
MRSCEADLEWNEDANNLQILLLCKGRNGDKTHLFLITPIAQKLLRLASTNDYQMVGTKRKYKALTYFSDDPYYYYVEAIEEEERKKA